MKRHTRLNTTHNHALTLPHRGLGHTLNGINVCDARLLRGSQGRNKRRRVAGIGLERLLRNLIAASNKGFVLLANFGRDLNALGCC